MKLILPILTNAVALVFFVLWLFIFIVAWVTETKSAPTGIWLSVLFVPVLGIIMTLENFWLQWRLQHTQEDKR